MDKQYIIDFIFSLKWLWLLLFPTLWNVVNILNNYLRERNMILRQNLLKDIDIDQEALIKQLDSVIEEALDQYILFNITPKNMYYINSNTENEILNYLTTEVPTRVSPIIIDKLTFIYNSDYIGKYLGNRIYITVLNYVTEFNVNNSPEKVEQSIDNELSEN